MVVVGVGVLCWAFVVWKWEDPFTSVYTGLEQRELRSELAALNNTQPLAAAASASSGEALLRVRREARRLRADAEPGSAIGRLRVPRLDLSIVVVDGTDTSSLKRGPGLDGRTFMPGEGRLIYVAGHRTTFGAPFSAIDTLQVGDRVTLEMPYGRFTYVVQRHRIVDASDLSVLESGAGEEIALQACHPRFFATQRYIVWAVPEKPARLGGRTVAVPTAA